MEHIVINTAQGPLLYALFYHAAFLTVILFFIIPGLRGKYSAYKILLITATGVLFFILGNKIFAIHPTEWKNLLTGHAFSGHGGKTILGGLVGLLCGTFLAVRWLKTDIRVIDNLAAALPMGMAVTRLGCLFAGCCYGKPATLPWAISYMPGSHAHASQVYGGLIPPDAVLAQPVHPVQLYDLLLCLIIAVVVWRTGKAWRTSGNKLLFAIMLYGCARFFLEFLRDPSTHSYLAHTFLGIKLVQWAVLAGVCIIGLLIFLREKNTRRSNIFKTEQIINPWRPVSLAIFLVLLFTSLHNWFDSLETTTIVFVLLPAVCLTGCIVIRHFLAVKYRFITVMVMLSCFLLMSQAYIPQDDKTKVRFFEVGAGGIFGSFNDITARAYKDTDCYGDVYYDLNDINHYKYDYRLAGISMAYHERIGPYKRLSFKLSGYYGKEDRKPLDAGAAQSITLWDINPSLNYGGKIAGFEVGFHTGNISYAHAMKVSGGNHSHRYAEWVYDHNPDRQLRHTFKFYPHLGIRIGPQHIAYFDMQYGSSFSTGSPLTKFRIGAATGLGKWDGTKLGAGYSTGGLYIAGTFPVQDRYVIETLFIENFRSGSNNRFNFSLAFSYRFGYKTKEIVKGVD